MKLSVELSVKVNAVMKRRACPSFNTKPLLRSWWWTCSLLWLVKPAAGKPHNFHSICMKQVREIDSEVYQIRSGRIRGSYKAATCSLTWLTSSRSMEGRYNRDHPAAAGGGYHSRSEGLSRDAPWAKKWATKCALMTAHPRWETGAGRQGGRFWKCVKWWSHLCCNQATVVK